jgi:NADPH:quinone reductase-like Zn-dependent oxidoreductase
MKAIVWTKYGPPDVLQLKDVEKPVPKDNEVLIKVHAASINDWDWGLLRGVPFANRMMFGLRKPKFKILGGDIAGRVEAVGSKVQKFKPSASPSIPPASLSHHPPQLSQDQRPSTGHI